MSLIEWQEWEAEQLRTIEIAERVAETNDDAFVRLKLWELLHRQASKGLRTVVKSRASQLLETIRHNQDSRFVLLVTDRYSQEEFDDDWEALDSEAADTNAPPFPDRRRFTRNIEFAQQVTREWVEAHSDPTEGFNVFNDWLERIDSTRWWNKGWTRSNAVLLQLASDYPGYARAWCEIAPERPDSRTTGKCADLLSELRRQDQRDGLTLARGFLAKDHPNLWLCVASSYSWPYWAKPPLPEEWDIVQRLLAFPNGQVKRKGADIVGSIASMDFPRAINLVLTTYIGDDSKLADTLFAIFEERRGFNFKSLSTGELETLVSKLTDVESVRDYHLSQFLLQAALRDPILVVKFLLERLKRKSAMARDTHAGSTADYAALQNALDQFTGLPQSSFHDEKFKEILNHPCYREALRLIRDAALNEDYSSVGYMIRWISLFTCVVLFVSSLGLTPTTKSSVHSSQAQQSANGRRKRVLPKPPEPRAPTVNLPNLDEARQRGSAQPRAAQAVESTVRSRRKPLESRNGMKAGDPIPRVTPSPSASPPPRTNPSPAGGPRRSASPSPSATPTATPSASLDLTRRDSGSRYFSENLVSLLVKTRIRALDHPTLRFLNVRFAVDPAPLGNPLHESSFNLLSPPVPQSGASKIVFASDREGIMQIYVMNSNGSGLVRLTYSGANDSFPRWSPNGTKILFQSDRDHPETGCNDIYVMNSDGSGVTRLTTDANDDSMASWSPDGSKIVFQSFRNGVNYQVYSMNADGSGQVCLTNTSSNDGEPSWSPNGAKIAFASDRDHAGTNSVYVMNSNGTGQQRLTSSAATFDDRQPAWSRDGAKIAFVSTRDSVTETWTETDDFEIPEDDGQTFPKSRLHINKEIYVMNGDGSSQVRLTNDLANDDAPSWSPDGNKIVFRSDRERDCCDPSAQIWTMNADGSGQTDVSNDGTGNYTASWTNNGSGNMSPVADAGGAYSGTIAQNVPFHGNNSYDTDGTIVSYSWSFGDGGSASGINPTHAYGANGSYTVTLTVTDNLGAQATAQTTANISTSSSDQFAQGFLYWGLGRTPNGDEDGYWSDIMRAAYPQGQPSMLMAMKEFGMTVFESQEYAQRNRSNHEYVWDLYRTYLMRDANEDPDGWNFWTSACDSYGRESVRQAFDESGEFHGIVSSLSASGNPSSAVSSLATAQVDPFNQTGNQIQARDCEWSVPLISLPGRAGLDLGLSLSYSSLVWTRSGPYAYFDQDYESLSPGFTIGFPTVQWRKFDAKTGRNVYVLTAAGRHTELRQIGSTDIYEAADSSYLQLIDYGGSLALRTTDGTELSFAPLLHGYNVTQIKDRNGNFITVDNDWRGDIQHVTDTVNRTITFNYDANANLNSIIRTGTAQPWATFRWGNAQMQPTFGEVVGTYAGENILALNFVGFDDGSYTRFNYNGYGQVREIKHFASDSDPNADNHLLNTMVYNYGASDDPTRLTDMRVSAENWTGTNDVPSQLITQFSASGDVHEMTAPDGTIYKETYGGTGNSPVWQHGLVISTQVLTGSTVQKTTATAWAQDDPDASYQTNPRVYQTDVSDGTNHRKTTIGYQTFALPTTNASCSLPNEVYEYDADQSTVLRRTHTDYVPIANYINDYRRIVGLPVAKLLYEGTSTLRAKTTYVYDQPEFMQNTAGSAIQHDDYNFSTGFVAGRGNLTTVIRWDVDDPNQTAKTENKIGYDITGNVVLTRDALNHETGMSYSDAFSIDGTILDAARSFATFAYPTTVTDPDGHASTLWYRYDFGAKTRTQGPPPGNPGQYSTGVVQSISYDDAARIQRVTTVNTGAYTHYFYGPNYTQRYSSVNNIAQNYSDSDAYAIQVFDGAGQVIYNSGNHPSSIGGYRTVSSIYDKMGRLAAQSNPTEITGSGAFAGDDDPNNPNGQGHGFVYTQYTYDWKGRSLLTINPSTTSNPNDVTFKEASYVGCGCAGGEVVTIEDEVGRQQKVYSDILGRQWKSEIWTWPDANNNRGVYSTSVSVFNARDQVTRAYQYSGNAPFEASSTNENPTCPDGSCQKATMGYDGYGRLLLKHVPQQETGTATAFLYNPDDTIQRVTDARGAYASYSYNARHLVTGIDYTAPSGVNGTPSVGIEYDAAGNRRWMTDGSGRVDYGYDQLSLLRSETRQFNGLSGSFALTYDYNVAGELKRIIEPSGSHADYLYDSAGRLINLSGTGLGTSQYLSSLQYRASGALKSVSNGDSTTLALGYDTRMQVTSYSLGGVRSNGSIQPEGGAFQYYPDGRIKFASDLRTDATAFGLHDRAYSYDHAGRLKEAFCGYEARDFNNGTNSGTQDGAFRQSYGHDAWSNLTSRTGRFWSEDDSATDTYNGQNRNPLWDYDLDGRLFSTNDPPPDELPYQALRYAYDGAGRRVQSTQTTSRRIVNNHVLTTAVTNAQVYDGNGFVAKTVNTQQINTNSPTITTTFFLRSSLTGNVIGEYDSNGVRQSANVFAGSQMILRARRQSDGSDRLMWQHINPITSDGLTTDTQGAVIDRGTVDPMGVNVGDSDPFAANEPTSGGQSEGMSQSTIDAIVASIVPGWGGPKCKVDFMVTGCRLATSVESSGAGVRVSLSAPSGVFIRFSSRTTGQSTSIWSPLTIMDTGRGTWAGYVPMGAHFGVDGHSNIFEINLSQIAAPGSRNLTYVGMLRELPGGYALHDVWLQTPHQIPPDAEGIRANLAKQAADPGCADFIKDLLNRVATPENPMVEGGDLAKIFDKVMTQWGISRGGNAGGAQANNSIGDGGANIVFGTVGGSNMEDQYFGKYLLWFDSHSATHEVVHLGLLHGVDDEALARALFPDLPKIPFPKNGTQEQINSWVLHWSNIWDTELRKHCKPADLGIPGRKMGP